MMSRPLLMFSVLCIAASIVVWPALYNGQPFFFSDTTAYIRGADAGVEKLTGISTSWSHYQELGAHSGQDTPGTTQDKPSSTLSQDRAVLSGRSVYYGVLLYIGYLAGNFWLTIWLQGLALSAAIALMLRACSQLTLPRFSLMAAVLCFTPAALFASFLMPDIFAGITVLACAMLIAGTGSRLRLEHLFWSALLAFAFLSHSSHVLIGAVMFVFGLVARYATRPRTKSPGLLLIAIALAVAYFGETLFNSGVARYLGQEPIRPPFLMARTIQDGPGYEYLRATCPDNGFMVCRFIDRLPLSADEFLWLEDPKRGVFAIADPDTKRALSHEQARLFFHAIAQDPWGQLSASLRNAVQQLTSVEVNEFQYWEGDKPTFASKLPMDTWASMQKSAAYLGTMPIRTLSVLSIISAIVGSIYIAIRLIQTRFRHDGSGRISVHIAAFVSVGVIVNAIICGALSVPHDRYQARVVWLLPVVALLLDLDFRQQWWNGILTCLRDLISSRTNAKYKS